MSDHEPVAGPSPPTHRDVSPRLARFLGARDPLPIDPDLAPDDAAAPSPTHRAGPLHTHRTRPSVLLLIGAGGFLGTIARYGAERAWPTAAGHFPTATFLINASGAFLLGLFLAGVIERRGASPRLRPFVATGVLGGWTTYSTFSVEVVNLTKHGHAGVGAEYLIASFGAGLGAVALGIALGRSRAAGPDLATTGEASSGDGGTP